MWVYQEQQNLPALSAGADAPEPVEPGLVPECSAPVAETLPAEPIIEEAEAKEKIPKRTLPHASRDCILLAGAYLFGTFLAGALSALCSAGELETLGYYLDCWRASFAANTAAEVVGLFRTEFLTTSGALVVLLLLGLSAIGSLPIFFFVMLYGTGAGMLSFQLLADLNWKALAAYCIASGVPTALAAGCLCLFGRRRCRSAGRSSAVPSGRRFTPPAHGGSWGSLPKPCFCCCPSAALRPECSTCAAR